MISSAPGIWRGRKIRNDVRPGSEFGINKAAGLFDDPVDRRESKAGALADFFGGEKRLEDLLYNVGWNAGPGVADFNQNIIGSGHAFVCEVFAFRGRNIGRAQGELSAVRHGIAGVDREVHNDLLELRNIDLHRPQVAAVNGFQHHLLADQPLKQHPEIAQDFAEIEHLRPQRLLARKRSN